MMWYVTKQKMLTGLKKKNKKKPAELQSRRSDIFTLRKR